MAQIEAIGRIGSRGGFRQKFPRYSDLLKNTWVLLAACGLVAIAGGLYIVQPRMATMFVAAIVAVPVARLVWLRPVYGLVALVFLAASFVQPNLISLRLLGGGLDMRDITLLGLLGIGVTKGILRKKLQVPWWPVSLPLLVYFGIAIFSGLFAVLLQGVSTNWAFSELRAIFYIAAFFATAWNIEKARDMFILLISLIILADLTAAVILMQQFLGRDNLLLSAMLGNGWYLRSVGDAAGDFGDVRVVPPGNVMMYMVAIISFALMLQANQPSRRRLFFIGQFIFLAVAILFTYTRAQWIASALAMALVVAFIPGADKKRLIRYLLVIVVVAGIVSSVFSGDLQKFLEKEQFIGNVVARALTIFTPEATLETNSLQWRAFENGEAIKSIALHPLLGVGLGNAYRDITLLQWEDRRFYFRKTRFVHNSYLYITVKMGIPGLAAFLAFSLSFVVCGWLALRKMAEGDFKRITVAILASYIGLLLWSNSQMHFMSVESTAVVGLMVGMVAAMSKIKQEGGAVAQPEPLFISRRANQLRGEA
ncbi:MAG: O-antigen ligase family protein [Chloroflexota bacterium]